VNKNAIPNDPEKPFVTSGIRVGSPAMTTRGFKDAEAKQVANFIADVLEAPGDERILSRTAESVKQLCGRFPVYAYRLRTSTSGRRSSTWARTSSRKTRIFTSSRSGAR